MLIDAVPLDMGIRTAPPTPFHPRNQDTYQLPHHGEQAGGTIGAGLDGSNCREHPACTLVPVRWKRQHEFFGASHKGGVTPTGRAIL